MGKEAEVLKNTFSTKLRKRIDKFGQIETYLLSMALRQYRDHKILDWYLPAGVMRELTIYI